MKYIPKNCPQDALNVALLIIILYLNATHAVTEYICAETIISIVTPHRYIIDTFVYYKYTKFHAMSIIRTINQVLALSR